MTERMSDEERLTISSRPGYDASIMKEGYLQKQGQLLKGWKKRWFVCDGNSLSYFHAKGDKIPSAVIPLETATVQDGGTSERWNGPRIHLTDTTTGILYCLSGEDGNVVLQWFDILQKAILYLHDKHDDSVERIRAKSHSAPVMANGEMTSPRKTAKSVSAFDMISTHRKYGEHSKGPPPLATNTRLENQLSTATELLSCLLLNQPTDPSTPIHFQHIGIHDRVRMSTVVDSATGKEYLRSSMVLEVVPAVALRLLLDHPRRREWDALFPQSTHVASYNGTTDLVYLSSGSLACLIPHREVMLVVAISIMTTCLTIALTSFAHALFGALFGALAGCICVVFMTQKNWSYFIHPRDALLLRHVYEAPIPRLGTSAMAVAEWSVSNELRPLSSGVVRSNIEINGWLVQSYGTESTLLTYVTSISYGGWIPPLVAQELSLQRMKCLAAMDAFVNHAKIRGLHLGFDGEEELDDLTTDVIDDLEYSNGSDSSMSNMGADGAPRGSLPFHPRDYLRSVVRNPAGGVTLTDKEVAKKQNGVLMEVIRNFGSKLLDGKSAVSLSLPVRIFEPRTMLDRLVDLYLYAPNYLATANDTNDMIERFKLTMTFAVAGWHHWVGCAKPFNPIVGETLQASFIDGATVHCEQAASHPSPISYAQIIHPKYQINSYAVLNGSLQTNSLLQVQQGPIKVQFTDGCIIEFTPPTIRMSGLLWGERVIELVGTILFQDKINGLQCELKLNPDENKGMFASNKVPSDHFRGTLINTTANEPLCQVSGSWLDHLQFGDKTYWSLETDSCAPLNRTPDDQVLPSDSRNRPDLRALAQNDLDEAQARKFEVEKIQRSDRALRKEGRRPNHWTYQDH